MDEWISAAILTIIWFGIWLVTVWWAYRLGKSDGYTKAWRELDGAAGSIS